MSTLTARSAKPLTLILAALALLGASLTARAQEGEPLRFEDPALERAVRGQTLKADGPLYAADVELIDSLYVEWPEADDTIQSLAGIEALTGLTRLNLRGNAVSDLTPLASLTQLEDLTLSHNRVTDVSALANLKALRYLELRDNQVVSLAALADLENLTSVNVSDNRVVNLAGLDGLPELSELALHGNALEDLSGLEQLPNLLQVTLYDNPALDLCPGGSARQVVDGLMAAGVRVAYVERGAGDAPCEALASVAPVRVVMNTGGQEEFLHLQGGRLARLNPDGTRVLASCVGSVQTISLINEQRGVYWSGLMEEFVRELATFIAVHLLPDDPEVRYAVDVQVEEVGQESVAGYAAQHYEVNWRPDDQEGGADKAWALMQELWVAPELGRELEETGCSQVAIYVELFQLLQGAFSSQRFYGLSGSPDYGQAVTGGFPVRAIMHAPGSDAVVETIVTSVDAESAPAGSFELPAGLERVSGVSDVF